LSLVAYDDQYNAAQAKTAVDRLVEQDGVKYIMGPVGSPGALSRAASQAAYRRLRQEVFRSDERDGADLL
jgi:ABC-type branched-subunit amino acid transport system substrate-binding protein